MEKEIYLLQAVDTEDSYKLTCIAIEVGKKPTEEMVKKAIDFVYDEFDEDQQEFEDGVKEIINFNECTTIRGYEFFWEKTVLYCD